MSMRPRFSIFVACMIIGSAVATGGEAAGSSPIDASKKGVQLKLPAGMTAKSPGLTAPQLDLAKARKAASARAWGLPANNNSLQPSLWLTPQQPYLPSGAQIQLVRDVSNEPVFTPDATFPYGHIVMGANGSMRLKDVPADPRDWLLMECIVSGAEYFTFSTSLRTGPGELSPTSGTTRRRLPRTGNLVTVLFEPSTEGKRYIGMQSASRMSAFAAVEWSFGGCELTPIRL